MKQNKDISKRSEMVTYLVKLLKHWEDSALDEMAADEILEGLEHMGMQPPGYEGRIATGEKYTPEMGAVDVTWFRGWEPEERV
jgi:hypothetical protein